MNKLISYIFSFDIYSVITNTREMTYKPEPYIFKIITISIQFVEFFKCLHELKIISYKISWIVYENKTNHPFKNLPMIL